MFGHEISVADGEPRDESEVKRVAERPVLAPADGSAKEDHYSNDAGKDRPHHAYAIPEFRKKNLSQGLDAPKYSAAARCMGIATPRRPLALAIFTPCALPAAR